TMVTPNLRNTYPVLIPSIISEISSQYNLEFALVNSIESRYVLEELSKNSITSVLLVHEFFGNTSPGEEYVRGFMWASSVVFPAKIVKESAITDQTRKMLASSHILHQGKSIIRSKYTDEDDFLKDLAMFKE